MGALEIMRRKLSRGGVALFGVILLVAGGVAMLQGWETIQIERGWSLFIGGAVLFAGGAVVTALGQVIARLDELLALWADPEPEPSRPLGEPAAAPQALGEALPVEVDRHQSGELTYVIFSDGAVEVRSPGGSTQRYASLAELRAHAGRAQ
jgi:hypothetical protein